MDNKFKTNDKVEYYDYKWLKRFHKVGYIKDFRRTLFGMRYFICTADGTKRIDIIKPSHIFGIAPNKYYKHPKSNENGNI